MRLRFNTSISVHKHNSIVSDTVLVKWKCSASYVAVAYIVVWHMWFEQHTLEMVWNFMSGWVLSIQLLI